MRFLHLADLHIGKRVNGFSMLDDQIYILNEILKIVVQYRKGKDITVCSVQETAMSR